ncbi:hypothetical protein J40TS1_22250 [Paenibacillus montaniterrae]|uniref:Uncharacterized protein n=1 Tax=Paenibacillus montaniterrae TaxID=429341 RepID=A0A920CYN8_9BACL|nr:hypothetical protein [Paenibacillus montaniterrae]GIP16583.1 hypothetical protein J40TS1_22250 [Paenibacillus montaniterrae]
MSDLDTFLYFRPILILFVGILVILLITTLFQKRHNKTINLSTISITVVISLVVSTFLIYQMGILSDELAVGADSASTILFIVIIILSLANVLAYILKR